MRVRVLATGVCRNKAILDLESEYYKRIGGAWRIELRELAEGKNKRLEGVQQLAELEKMPSPRVKIVLDERGVNIQSTELKDFFMKWQGEGIKAVGVVIGGADGVDEAVQKQANLLLSFGKMTFPHQLVRVMWAEQLYRVHTLVAGHPYHRG